MLKWLMLCGSILLLSFTVAAQDFAASPDESSVPSATVAASPAATPAPAPTFLPSPKERSPWELVLGYQYQHYNVLGLKFHDNGYHTDVVRYFTDWLGLEGTVALGFGGNTGAPYNLKAKSLFFAGGPHLSAPNSRKVQPYVHALFGDQHLRFTQYGTLNGTLVGSNDAFAWVGGGGFDFKFWPRVTWKVQADYLVTTFQNKSQNNFAVGSAFGFNF